MGESATAVAGRLRDRLADLTTGREWTTEYPLGRTSVDVAGTGPSFVAVELEWRRADPADNTAKLFRHLAEGSVDPPVVVCQVFSGYYDLARGGVSSKRENAEFVGRVAQRALEGFTYHPLRVDLDPPTGDDLPAGWREATDATAEDVADRVADST